MKSRFRFLNVEEPDPDPLPKPLEKHLPKSGINIYKKKKKLYVFLYEA